MTDLDWQAHNPGAPWGCYAARAGYRWLVVWQIADRWRWYTTGAGGGWAATREDAMKAAEEALNER